MSRASLPRPSLQDVTKAAQKIQGARSCLARDTDKCAGNIVKAHSVQRARLQRLTETGHVYTWNMEIPALVKSKGQLEPRRFGINRASTFTGFCAHHDNTIFSPIEDEELTPKSQHAALLSYRSLCRELYTKRGQLGMTEYQRSLDTGLSPRLQRFVQTQASDMEKGGRAGLRDLESYKVAYDAILDSGDYDDIESVWIEAAGEFQLSCAGGIFPEYDFAGAQLQDLSDLESRMDLLHTSVVPGSPGLVVLSWLKSSQACRAFAESLLSLKNEQIPHAITRMAFEYFENIFFRISWWDSLSEDDRYVLRVRARSGMPDQYERPHDALRDDSQRVTPWRVVAVHRRMG